ncbi:MAG: RNA polymerase sigma factor [Gemmataceae bacterium]
MAEALAFDSTAECGSDEPTDHVLLQNLRGGDCEAATRLYRRYAKRLRQLIRAKSSPALARRLDADDIMQSVFQVFFQGASGGCYEVPAGEELWPLLLVIALNKIRSHGSFHRAAKRDVRLTCGWDDAGAVQGALSRLEVDEPLPFLQLIAEETLERMPPTQRRIVELRVAGYEVEEIARTVGRSKRTVERILQTCRRQLGELLEEVDANAVNRPCLGPC